MRILSFLMIWVLFSMGTTSFIKAQNQSSEQITMMVASVKQSDTKMDQLKKFLTAQKGVQEVSICHQTGNVTMTIQKNQTDSKTLTAALQKKGYDVGKGRNCCATAAKSKACVGGCGSSCKDHQ